MSGKDKIVIKEYDPSWITLFAEEHDAIMDSIGHYVAEIRHIGSTSVPGLAAKPVVDILVGLRRLLDAQDCILPLEGMGYEYHPEYEVEFPDRRYFRKSLNGRRTHQIHIVEIETDFWKSHIYFRDYLESHPAQALQYSKLKRNLAAEFENDRERYTEAKAPFIERILESKDS